MNEYYVEAFTTCVNASSNACIECGLETCIEKLIGFVLLF